jgi:hypothetical protein
MNDVNRRARVSVPTAVRRSRTSRTREVGRRRRDRGAAWGTGARGAVWEPVGLAPSGTAWPTRSER